ncbi:hypothetical protein PIB30_015800 [Stylosanthes scabra]|uniref:Uncharacterized protein n=1 Tax=Stylosanthes scabra TaxID=79078 RepID=A0ABU6Z8W4_9FABA|nr:hypothetical protein [Stylosanthes scabra]
MDPEASRTARESLELAFQMSNILDTGLDRHTLFVLIALCDLGVNPEALAALVKELRNEKPSMPSETTPSSSADHLSRLENDTPSALALPIKEEFPDEQLFQVQLLPWFADIANFKAMRVIPNDFNKHQRRMIIELVLIQSNANAIADALAKHVVSTNLQQVEWLTPTDTFRLLIQNDNISSLACQLPNIVRQKIIALSASANKLLKIQDSAEEYAALIMEELDPNNFGYIELRLPFRRRLREALSVVFEYIPLVKNDDLKWYDFVENVLEREPTLYVSSPTLYVSHERPRSNLRQWPHVVRGRVASCVSLCVERQD